MARPTYSNRGGLRFVSIGDHGRRLSKQQRRQRQGLVRPIRCPRCRQKTRQAPLAEGARRCLSCRSVITVHGQLATPAR